MRKRSNPISIDTGRKKTGTRRTSANHSATEREKLPAGPKRARRRQSPKIESAKTSTKSRPSKRELSSKPEVVRNPVDNLVFLRLPENRHPGLHERSHAAHLDGGPMEPHTKPAGIPHHGYISVGRKQP
jgi:hypothetical protein